MSQPARFPKFVDQNKLTQEWNLLAPERHRQLAANLDKSFSQVLAPWICERANGATTILDVGCGTGTLTSLLARDARHVVGIDPSEVSIEIATSHDKLSQYEVATAELWSSQNPHRRFELVVANMVLMDAVDLAAVCGAISNLAKGNRVLVTITHPAFWPIYWKYDSFPEFNYLSELFIETPFRTQYRNYSTSTTHIHRPLDCYLEQFSRSGLEVISMEELRGPEAFETFQYPRFIAFEMISRGAPICTSTRASARSPTKS